MNGRRYLVVLAALAFGAWSCDAILGIQQYPVGEVDGGGEGGSDGASDSAVVDDAGPREDVSATSEDGGPSEDGNVPTEDGNVPPADAGPDVCGITLDDAAAFDVGPVPAAPPNCVVDASLGPCAEQYWGVDLGGGSTAIVTNCGMTLSSDYNPTGTSLDISQSYPIAGDFTLSLAFDSMNSPDGGGSLYLQLEEADVFVGGDVFVFPGDCEVSVSGGTTSADCSQWCLPELMSNASYDAGASTSGVFVIARQNDIVTIVTNVAGQAQQLVAPLVGPIEVSLYTFGAFSVNVRSIVVTVPPGQDAGFISDTFQCNSL